MNKALNHALTHYDLKALAKSLKLTSIDVIKTTSVDIESHWFRSNGPADLYFWKAKDKIVKHQVSLFNQVVEWNEYDGVKTGYVNDEIDAGKAEVICFDQDVNDGVVEQAIEFLSKVDQLDQKVVEELISHYQFYNKWPGLSLSGIRRKIRKKMKSFLKKK